MNDVRTGEALTSKSGTDWDRLRQMSDAEVHAAIVADPEIVPTDEDFWESADVVLPQRKPTITIRLDADVTT